MSNAIRIIPTKFVNVRTGSETFGYRAYDNYDQCYYNTWDAIPDDDLEVLRMVLEDPCDALSGMLDFCEEEMSGLWIGDNYLEWDEIKNIIR
jgi:hypothetical protein